MHIQASPLADRSRLCIASKAQLLVLVLSVCLRLRRYVEGVLFPSASRVTVNPEYGNEVAGEK